MLVYSITCNETNETYYGSTTKTISHRLNYHNYNYDYNRDCESRQIINRGNYSVKVLEEGFETKQDMLWRERWYIENKPCVNVGIPIKTREEILARKKERSKTDKAKKESADYYQANKEKEKKRSKDHYEANKEKINKKNKVLMYCEVCGVDITKGHKARHDKSKQHLECLKTGKQYIKPDKTYEEKKSNKTICQCGGKYTYMHRSTHAKTKQHLAYLSTL